MTKGEQLMATQQETNRARWFEHIRQCKASSLTQKAYCEQHNLSQVNKYQYYQKLYSKLNKHSSSNSSGKNSFIQIHSPQQKPEHIELKLPNSLVKNIEKEKKLGASSSRAHW